MDFNSGIYFTGKTTPEQKEVANSVPTFLNTGELPDISEIIETTKDVGKPNVPIYELKAEEEARAKLKNHKEDENYEALVAAVKKWEPMLADADEMDHKALAVILDDNVLFDELMRSHKALDDTHSFVKKETNKWEKHNEMYLTLKEDMRSDSAEVYEVYEMIQKLM